MEFKKQPIRKSSPPQQPVKPKALPQTAEPEQSPKNGGRTKKTQGILIFICTIVILGLGFGIINVVKSIDFSSVIFSAGTNLRTDQNGNTNILLLGVGGKGHDGGDLTDTIMVASIHYDQKAIAMLSIPRDLYISDKNYPNGKINSVYALTKRKATSAQSLESLKKLVGEITGAKIQYYAKIDFGGFKRVVDAMGGIDVIVEKDIYDTEYPKDGTYVYETFSIEAGPQHLDGATALKYVRSRHGQGNENSDAARTLRQQQVIQALKEKALSLNILTNPGKIQEIYNSLTESVETDFTTTEMIELARIAKDFGKESIVSHQITSNYSNCGGFLYPGEQAKYGSAVLVPAGGNYDFIQAFTKRYFLDPMLIKQQEPIQIRNATKTRGLAGELGGTLTRLCFNVIHVANADNRDLERSTLYYQPGENGEKPPLINSILAFLPSLQIKPGIPETYRDEPEEQGTLYVIELGKDYLEHKLKDPYIKILNSYYAPSGTSTPASTPPAASPENTSTSETGAEPAPSPNTNSQ